MLLPGDCPLLDPRELDRLLTGVPEPYVGDRPRPPRHRHQRARRSRPPDAIGPAFGEGSCARHVAAARAAGIPFGVEELASLGLDLDTPADVVALTRELEARPRPRARAPRRRWAYERERRRASCAVRCRSPACPRSREGMRVGALIAARAELARRRRRRHLAEGRLQGGGARPRASRRSSRARRRASSPRVLGKEPALVELILDESREVLRAERGVLIVETRHGFVCANAGIDSSNLPEPDTVCAAARGSRRLGAAASAREIARGRPGRRAVAASIVSDSFGRAWRLGQAEVAIGCAGCARWTTGAAAATPAGASWRRP